MDCSWCHMCENNTGKWSFPDTKGSMDFEKDSSVTSSIKKLIQEFFFHLKILFKIKCSLIELIPGKWLVPCPYSEGTLFQNPNSPKNDSADNILNEWIVMPPKWTLHSKLCCSTFTHLILDSQGGSVNHFHSVPLCTVQYIQGLKWAGSKPKWNDWQFKT